MKFDKISAGEEVPAQVNVVVEVARGSRVRCEFDPALEAFRLVTVLEEGCSWPSEYGFIPSTCSQDGYPLDALVLTEEPTFPGCVIACRPVGVLNLTNGRRPDHKILAVPIADAALDGIETLADLPRDTTDRIADFFTANPMLTGEEETVEGWEGADVARDIVFRAWEGFLA